jgi:hypothetical protein
VELFRAEVVFDFEADSLEAAGQHLRRLQEAAEAVGFELKNARVVPRPPEQSANSPYSGTSYGPPLDP